MFFTACWTGAKRRARARGPLKRKRGQHAWWENWRRDIGIACVVYLAHIQLGLNPTRNRESRRARRPSACSIVAEALRRTGTDISESRVQNIWAGLSGEIIAFAAARGTFPSIRRN
jgi:hypothetical protein